MMFDGKAFGAEIVGIVKGYLDQQLGPLSARIDDLAKQVAEIPQPRDDSETVARMQGEIEGLRASLAAAEERSAEVTERIAELEAREPEKGEKGEPGEPGRDGADGKDGASVTVEDVAPLVAEEVAKAVAAIPVPQDGKDGRDGVDGKDGADGAPGADGKDGVGMAGGLIDRSGHLILTLTDGTTRDMGLVVGKDGAPGKDGEPGRDGFGFDDMETEYDGERTITFRWARGEHVVERSYRMPVILDRGVYKAGVEYERGDAVTWGGSLWIAQEPTSEKPDSGKGWRLSVKRGRDGKDGVVKEAPKPDPIKLGGKD